MHTKRSVKRTVIALAVISVLNGCAGHNDDANKSALENDESHSVAKLDQEKAPAISFVATPPATENEALPQLNTLLHDADNYSSDRSVPIRKATKNLTHVQRASSQAFYSLLPLNAPRPDIDRENYAHVDEHAIKTAATDPVSTFSIDVDSGSYANVRRFLNNDTLPPQDAVRVEELLNYFNYDYPKPDRNQPPFSVSTELAKTPWNDQTWLMQIGLKGFEIAADQRPASNLVFLLDVSGSMSRANKLPLLQQSFKMLTQQLNQNDRISIVVYAGASGVVLEPTSGDNQQKIMASLDQLHAGGSTNGADGIRLAYQLAEEAYIDNGVNRIILATDGDFNVGTVNFEQLLDLAERKRKSGVSLTTLGFGSGNYNDHLMEQLADAGNGNYAYIDSLQEARKVLVSEISSTLFTIAKDVKIQVEFNPDVVSEYRLIGYENRALKREDFNNDKVDAGEIGAGHTVTALYEITPVGSRAALVDPLRYGDTRSLPAQASSNEVAFVKLRYKQPDADDSQLVSYPVLKSALGAIESSSENLRFAAAVSAFGQQLKGSVYTGTYNFEQIHTLAKTAISKDQYGYRAEFLELVQRAGKIFARDQGIDRDEIAIATLDD